MLRQTYIASSVMEFVHPPILKAKDHFVDRIGPRHQVTKSLTGPGVQKILDLT